MKWVRYYQPDHQVNGLFRRAMVITLLGNVLLAGIKIAAAKLSDHQPFTRMPSIPFPMCCIPYC